ncbi:hypothetical protein [uncultured Pseudonocardia sp.]|uniref:hypothetical protein n=1 Tax=uncultured Pseudonocardia sp. TaxID=211455 RepID=UPI002616A177|nr:hypothetical protein [uncultured Pseudonocardia sp.]
MPHAQKQPDRHHPNPDHPDLTRLRASWAAAALGAHHRRSNRSTRAAAAQTPLPQAPTQQAPLPSTAGDLATLCADLIADVLHLVGGAGLPVWAVLSRAVGYFQEEDASEAAAAAAAAEARATQDDAPAAADGHPLHLEEVARLVREAGVNCVLDTSGGGVATIWAGPTHHETSYGIRFAALAGPGSFGWGHSPSVATTAEFFIGPDDDGEASPLDLAEVDARTDAQVAALIVAQARLGDPARALTRDTAATVLELLTDAGPAPAAEPGPAD